MHRVRQKYKNCWIETFADIKSQSVFAEVELPNKGGVVTVEVEPNTTEIQITSRQAITVAKKWIDNLRISD